MKTDRAEAAARRERDKPLRLREDQEREKFVRAMLAQIAGLSPEGRETMRAIINASWINGRNQILSRARPEPNEECNICGEALHLCPCWIDKCARKR